MTHKRRTIKKKNPFGNKRCCTFNYTVKIFSCFFWRDGWEVKRWKRSRLQPEWPHRVLKHDAECVWEDENTHFSWFLQSSLSLSIIWLLPHVAAVPPWVGRGRCSKDLLSPTMFIKLKRLDLFSNKLLVEMNARGLEAAGTSLLLYWRGFSVIWRTDVLTSSPLQQKSGVFINPAYIKPDCGVL